MFVIQKKTYKSQFFYAYIQIIVIIKSEIYVTSWSYSSWSIELAIFINVKEN